MNAFSNPPIWAAHARIPVDLDHGAECIYSANWTSSGKSDMIGVYLSGLKFPDQCPVTMAMPDSLVFTEASIVKRGLGKTEFNSPDAAKIITALSSDRYWFVIPFTKNHGMKNRAIGFTALINKNGRNSAVMMIRKKLYAQEFARLNQLTKGQWLSTKHVFMRNIGVALAVLGLGGVLGGIWSISEGMAVRDPVPMTMTYHSMRYHATWHERIQGNHGNGQPDST